MRVAICEDYTADAEHLKALCREYAASKKLVMQLRVYQSGEQLLREYAAFQADVLLLDIYMDGIDGVTAALRLREQGFSAPIVLVTCSADHYPAGYQIEAVHYLRKPVEKADFIEAMNRAGRRIPTKEKPSALSATAAREPCRLPVSYILRCETTRPEW